ncbi:MAG TPA: cytochrome C oxidase subunit IV family protein [Caldilineaceae bacterium]|nr:cytochrome C oxidase subunit IV family protein [Caldilineaceae bacterium]
MEHPGPSPRLYVLVYLALMVLLVLTVSVAWLASGVIELVLTLSIAVVKALLVILYFMHIRYGSRLTWLFAAAGFAWLAILLVLIMSDYLSRSWLTG